MKNLIEENIADVEDQLKEVTEELEKLDHRRNSYMKRYAKKLRELHLAKAYLLELKDSLMRRRYHD